jgi:hypothetical protein
MEAAVRGIEHTVTLNWVPLGGIKVTVMYLYGSENFNTGSGT